MELGANRTDIGPKGFAYARVSSASGRLSVALQVVGRSPSVFVALCKGGMGLMTTSAASLAGSWE